jgi:hypothetical protein
MPKSDETGFRQTFGASFRPVLRTAWAGERSGARASYMRVLANVMLRLRERSYIP